MTGINQKIIHLIDKNYNIKQISQILNISERQLYIRIKQIINYGYSLDANYCYNSDIYYNLKKDIKTDKYGVDIKLSKKENLFRSLVVSDTHIGSVDANIKLMDIVYDYATKNDINIIFNCGDVIEGNYTTSSKNIKNLHDQAEYFIKKHPYDKNIINFVVFGNHDLHSFIDYGFDFAKFVGNARYDIVPLGYGQGNVKIKNDSIILFHKLRDKYKPIINDEKILLSGHGHLMRTKFNDILWLGIPTLSYQATDKNYDIIPGFVDLSLEIENGEFNKVIAQHLIINPKVVQVGEIRGKVKNLFLDN